MALSLSNFLYSLLLLATAAQCATVTYDFDVGWVYANPDGQYTRPTIGINGKWPIPPIVATKGDQVIVNLKNSLGNQSTSLHFHGLYMNGTNQMDGVVGVTQCGIPPGSSFTYNFTVSLRFHVQVAGTDGDRSTNRGRTGTIATSAPSIQMASAARSLYVTQRVPSRTCTRRKS